MKKPSLLGLLVMTGTLGVVGGVACWEGWPARHLLWVAGGLALLIAYSWGVSWCLRRLEYFVGQLTPPVPTTSPTSTDNSPPK